VDDHLKVRHPPEAPLLELRAVEEPHLDEDIDRSDDLAPREECFHGADDTRVERVGSVAGDANHGTAGPREMAGMVSRSHFPMILRAFNPGIHNDALGA